MSQTSLFEPDLPIELVQVFKLPTSGNLKAYIQIKVGEITICDCRVIQQVGQRAYISGPQKAHNGGFVPLVKMSQSLKQRVEEAIIPKLIEQQIVKDHP